MRYLNLKVGVTVSANITFMAEIFLEGDFLFSLTYVRLATSISHCEVNLNVGMNWSNGILGFSRNMLMVPQRKIVSNLRGFFPTSKYVV